MKRLTAITVIVAALATGLIGCASPPEEASTPTEAISAESTATEAPAEPTTAPPTEEPPTPTTAATAAVEEEATAEPTAAEEEPTATSEPTPTSVPEITEIDPENWPEVVEDLLAGLDPGDPARGEELYTSLGCVACHGQLTDSATAAVGPWLGDIAERGAEMIEGRPAAQYVYESILYPNDVIVAECPAGPCPGPPSDMRQDLATVLAENPQDIADLLAYLLGE
jgi:cytochrome c2